MNKSIVSARIHEYQKPLSLDNISIPKVTHDEQILVKVGATGLCHSDLHLINGEWKEVIPIDLPKTPGHEVAGWVEETGNSVPNNLLEKGDLVAVLEAVAVELVLIVKVEMSKCVSTQNGQVYLHMMVVILNLCLCHHTDFL